MLGKCRVVVLVSIAAEGILVFRLGAVHVIPARAADAADGNFATRRSSFRLRECGLRADWAKNLGGVRHVILLGGAVQIPRFELLHGVVVAGDLDELTDATLAAR